MICFHFSIFEPLETVQYDVVISNNKLWFAFILVSLNHWKQSIAFCALTGHRLWFAFILVSLNHWKQSTNGNNSKRNVVICFHFSIFEPLETVFIVLQRVCHTLWFAFILVSLNHWKQYGWNVGGRFPRCDLLSF